MKSILKGKWVIDSHLIVYILDRTSPFYSLSQELFYAMIKSQIQPFVSIQNILEAENTLLRKYKLSPVIVVEKIETMLATCDFAIITPLVSTYLTFHDLIKNVIKEFDTYDYYLAATMLDNGLNRILTVNTKDFSQIKEIEAVNPFE